MKKLVSVMMSVVALTFGVVRSTQAQGLLTFIPKAPKSISKTPPADKLIDNTPAINFQTHRNQAPEPVDRSIDRSIDRSTSVTVRLAQSNSVIDDNDRLVAVAPDELFEGGSNSLVAKAVGSAEGTRTPDGGKTWAYYGHTDPGNGRWNMGSFSYQHRATTPEEADQQQLDRLWQQFELIRQSAASAGLRLGLIEQLNGIDLANQAPLAALDQGGYVDRLRQARVQGLRGSEAVLQARTYSYLNPRTNQWDAPGLGNSLDSISRDQARRQNAISEAVSNHLQVAQSRRLRDQTDVKVSQASK